MRGIYWRNGIAWARFKVRGIEYRQSLRTRSAATAEKRLNAAKLAIEEQVLFGASAPVSWQAAVISWDAAFARSRKRPSTVARYLVSLGQLRPWLDDKDVQRIDNELLRRIVRERARSGVTNATIRRDLTAVSSVLDNAMDEGWIEANPARTFDRRRLKEQRDPIVLPDDASIAAVAAIGSRFVDMMLFARQTGMREEEIASLTHAQVDRARMAITLTITKGRRARQVPIDPDALAIIDRQPPFLRSPFVFWRATGERFQNVHSQFYASVRRVAQKAARASEPFTRFRFHDLRHLFAVEFLRLRSGSIYDLQQILGHASIRTTEAYLDFLTPDEKQAAMQGVAQIAAHNQRFASGESVENG